jgi:hypothetical protein
MKKILLLLLLFCGITFFSEAQLTVSGTGDPYYNTNPLQVYTLGGSPNFLVPDAGTNVYTLYQGTLQGGIRLWVYLFRMNNFWYFANYAIAGQAAGNGLFKKYKFYSTSIDPPCDGPWGSPNTTVIPFVDVHIAGTSCFTPPLILSTTLNPTNLQIPALTAALIATIPNPQPGMMVWDLTNQCLKIYNGTAWVCIP